LATFIARVEFRMEADRLEAGDRRLRELAEAASAPGFELKRGQKRGGQVFRCRRPRWMLQCKT
jgi:hypothetical protein